MTTHQWRWHAIHWSEVPNTVTHHWLRTAPAHPHRLTAVTVSAASMNGWSAVLCGSVFNRLYSRISSRQVPLGTVQECSTWTRRCKTSLMISFLPVITRLPSDPRQTTRKCMYTWWEQGVSRICSCDLGFHPTTFIYELDRRLYPPDQKWAFYAVVKV